MSAPESSSTGQSAINTFRTASGKVFPKEVTYQILHGTFSILTKNGSMKRLRELQCLSKEFYAMVTPYLYKHIKLTITTFEKLFGILKMINPQQGYLFHVPMPEVSLQHHRWDTMHVRADPNLMRPERFRENLSFTKRVTLFLDEDWLSVRMFGLTSAFTKTLYEITGQLLLPNVDSISYKLSANHEPSEKVLDLMNIMCKPTNLCMKWNEYDPEDENVWESDEDPKNIRPIIYLFGSNIKHMVYHDIDVNLIRYIRKRSTRVSLQEIIPCEEDWCRYYKNDRHRHGYGTREGDCGLYYEYRPQADLMTVAIDPFHKSMEIDGISELAIVQGSRESSMSEIDLDEFRDEYNDQLKTVEKGEIVLGATTRHRATEAWKAREVKWYIGEEADLQPLCEACGEPV